MEGLENRLPKQRACLLAILGAIHGKGSVNGGHENGLSPLVFHTGDAPQSTALTRVMIAGPQLPQGALEAWRLLVLHHEPTSLTRSPGMSQEISNFSFDGEVGAPLAQFDRDVESITSFQQHSHRSGTEDDARWTSEEASGDEQLPSRHLGSVEGRNGTSGSEQQPSTLGLVSERTFSLPRRQERQ